MKHKTIEVPAFTIDADFKDSLAKSKRTSNCFRADEDWINRFILQDFRTRYANWELELDEWMNSQAGEAPQIPTKLTYTEVVRMLVRVGVETLKNLQAHNQPIPSKRQQGGE